MSLLSVFKRQCQREFLIHCRQPRYLLQSTLFFLMVAVFVPLTMPADNILLRHIAPGLMWIAVLFAMLLASANLFQSDYEEGIIEQWLISSYPLSLLVMAKLTVHWFLNLLPLLFFSPLLGLLFNLSWAAVFALMISLLAGTPAILFLSGLAAAFSSGMQQKGILMALILLPLTIPVMVFGSGSITAVMQGMPAGGHFAILLAFSLLCAGFLPFAIAAVIRVCMAE